MFEFIKVYAASEAAGKPRLVLVDYLMVVFWSGRPHFQVFLEYIPDITRPGVYVPHVAQHVASTVKFGIHRDEGVGEPILMHSFNYTAHLLRRVPPDLQLFLQPLRWDLAACTAYADIDLPFGAITVHPGDCYSLSVFVFSLKRCCNHISSQVHGSSGPPTRMDRAAAKPKPNAVPPAANPPAAPDPPLHSMHALDMAVAAFDTGMDADMQHDLHDSPDASATSSAAGSNGPLLPRAMRAHLIDDLAAEVAACPDPTTTSMVVDETGSQPLQPPVPEPPHQEQLQIVLAPPPPPQPSQPEQPQPHPPPPQPAPPPRPYQSMHPHFGYVYAAAAGAGIIGRVTEWGRKDTAADGTTVEHIHSRAAKCPPM